MLEPKVSVGIDWIHQLSFTNRIKNNSLDWLLKVSTLSEIEIAKNLFPNYTAVIWNMKEACYKAWSNFTNQTFRNPKKISIISIQPFENQFHFQIIIDNFKIDGLIKYNNSEVISICSTKNIEYLKANYIIIDSDPDILNSLNKYYNQSVILHKNEIGNTTLIFDENKFPISITNENKQYKLLIPRVELL